MVREMRRDFQQVDDTSTLERWLKEALVGRLATVDEEGYPVIKPVNFVYDSGCIFFHSAPEGEKLDDIRRDARVGFEIDRLFAITPPPQRGCQTHCFYQSVIIRGVARILGETEDQPVKERALRLLIEKYSSGSRELSTEDVERTAVVEITIGRITGKE
ncbi:MAG: pyridoxamine 5'-phosphate oxidase family protein, partial [Anaerolineae bacterium]